MLFYSKLSFTALYCNYSHWVSNFIFSMLNLSSDFGFFFFFWGGGGGGGGGVGSEDPPPTSHGVCGSQIFPSIVA